VCISGPTPFIRENCVEMRSVLTLLKKSKWVEVTRNLSKKTFDTLVMTTTYELTGMIDASGGSICGQYRCQISSVSVCKTSVRSSPSEPVAPEMCRTGATLTLNPAPGGGARQEIKES